ncbi:MAG: monovalent cation/H+ antiporter subunit D family protein [Burkholderiales bacterium]
MILDHLPALQVVAPLLAAPLIVLLRSGRAGWLIATLVSWISLAVAILLFVQVREAGVISYALGSWPPPWGIEYRVDAMSSYVLVLVALIAAVVLPYARASVIAEVPSDRHYLFYAMFALLLCGLLGIVITGDAFNVFVFLEISSLSGYVLIALGRDRRALRSAFQYLIMGTIGATFYVIGVGLLYLMTGTLNIADMAVRLAAVEETRPVLAALAFITVGLSLKIALFPLHVWLPGAYAYAPSAVSAFMAGTVTKVSVYVLLRFVFGVFGVRLALPEIALLDMLMVFSAAAMIVASLVAVYERDLRRLLAYSSVAQIGYITLGLSLANADGMTASVVHLFNHGVTKTALFMLAGCVVLRLGTCRMEALAGLGRRMPATSLGIVLAGLGLIGVPGTAGFITKWHLVFAALQDGHWWILGVIAASSLLAAAYVWRFVEIAYLRTAPAGAAAREEAPLQWLVPAWALVVASIYFGLDTSFSLSGARDAAAFMLGGLR